jgi:integrase
MPRRKSPPRLWLDRARQQWVIRDGPRFVRTGCPESDREGAEKQLADYLGHKHKPESGPDPLIADVLMVYAHEHLPHTRAAQNGLYNVESLARGPLGPLRLSNLTAAACRGYAETKRAAAARRDLETLRAAIRHWARERGPITVPNVVLPPKSEPRERWLTRSEAAKLLWAARRVEHLKRFILIGLYTGSRSGVILNLKWEWIDVERGIMRRRDEGERESNKRRPPVRLGRKLLSFLRRWKHQDHGGRATCVVHYDGDPIQKLRRSWASAVSRSGVACSPHDLRRTRATWLMQNGIDVWEAAGHLGMSVETLQRVYAKHHPDFQKRAAEV